MPDDLLADLAGGLRGLLGERLHLGRHHRKAATGLAGTRRLDRGVQRQQIGLAGDGVDQFDHIADAACRLRQLADAAIGLLRLVHGLIGNAGRFLHLTADLVDRGGQFLAGRGYRLHIGGCFFRSRRDRGREALGPFRRLCQRIGRGLQFGRGRGHGLDDLSDRAFERIGEFAHVRLALLRLPLLRPRAVRRAAARLRSCCS